MFFSKKYLCSKCHRKVLQIRYSHDGLQQVCNSCYTPLPLKNEPKPILKPSRVKLICTNCRYHFSFRIGSHARLMCPYCGRDNLIKDNTTADRLLAEVARMPA
ncbi:MAG TPA: hypothetical protein VJH97_03890 [Candidatus Nanoarchaeia archaeon]|nr:hypothetical protein [Candidatus Nanoarchaeia archaeon]